MCGGFVCFYAGQGGRGQTLAHAAYNLGRLVTYLTLGLAAGLLGGALDRAGAAAGVHRAGAIAAGAVMLLWGAASLAAALGARLPAPGAPAALRARVAAAIRAVHAQPPAVRALTVGLVTTLLPCGWLWAWVATAAGTGRIGPALFVMAAFWLGTVPMMAGLALVLQRALGPLRRRVPLFTSAMLVVLGLLTLSGRLTMGGMGGHAVVCAPVSSAPAPPAALPSRPASHVGR